MVEAGAVEGVGAGAGPQVGLTQLGVGIGDGPGGTRRRRVAHRSRWRCGPGRWRCGPRRRWCGPGRWRCGPRRRWCRSGRRRGGPGRHRRRRWRVDRRGRGPDRHRRRRSGRRRGGPGRHRRGLGRGRGRPGGGNRDGPRALPSGRLGLPAGARGVGAGRSFRRARLDGPRGRSTPSPQPGAGGQLFLLGQALPDRGLLGLGLRLLDLGDQGRQLAPDLSQSLLALGNDLLGGVLVRLKLGHRSDRLLVVGGELLRLGRSASPAPPGKRSRPAAGRRRRSRRRRPSAWGRGRAGRASGW